MMMNLNYMKFRKFHYKSHEQYNSKINLVITPSVVHLYRLSILLLSSTNLLHLLYNFDIQ